MKRSHRNITRTIIVVTIVACSLWFASVVFLPNNHSKLINLDGEWEFYWQQLLEPDDFRANKTALSGMVHVPGAWNGYQLEGKDLLGQGYATYRTSIQVEQTDQLVGLRVPRILTAYRLWINGIEVAQGGKVGTTRQETKPQYLPQQAFFYAGNGRLEIVIQVANFHHRSGGILNSIQLGDAADVLSNTKSHLGYELFLVGGLLILGIYHVILFAYRKSEKTLLYFSFFALMGAVRTMLVGEIFFIQLFPNFNWELAHKMQTLCYYLGVGVVILFTNSLFRRYIRQLIVKISQGVVVAFSALVLLTPARVFTIFNPVFQGFTLLMFAYFAYILIKAMRGREPGSVYIGIGTLVLFLTVINDLLYLSVLRGDRHFLQNVLVTGNLSSIGLLVFAFCHSLILAVNYARAFQEKEELSASLEAIVAERTKQIEVQNKELAKTNYALTMLSLKDSLTDTWNRRHFEYSLQKEWQNACSKGDYISMIFVDIDEFKTFNDLHGHQVGDQYLQKVAAVLKDRAKRAGDIVSRYGGDEFVILLPDSDPQVASAVAKSMRDRIEALQIVHKETDDCLTVSIGVASVIPTEEHSPKDLIRAADQAMYSAKQQGKNRMENVTLAKQA